MKAELTEIEGVKYLVVPPGTHMIIGVAQHDSWASAFDFDGSSPLFSKEQIKAFEKVGIYDIPIIFVDDISNVKLFQFECPVCRMFLDATHRESDDAEKS